MDGLGAANLVKKLAAYYNGDEIKNSELSWQSIAEADQEYIKKSELYQQSKTFWKQQLADLPEPMLTAHYRQKNKVSDFMTSSRSILRIKNASFEELEEKWIQTIAKVAQTNVNSDSLKKHRMSKAQVLMAVVAMYFSKAYDRRRISMGISRHNRESSAQAKLLGQFAKISPLFLDIDDGHTFLEFVSSIKAQHKNNVFIKDFPSVILIERRVMIERNASMKSLSTT